MEALYSKLYDKYNKLKTKKFTELDEINKDQEVKFMNYVSVAEELIQHLRNENEKLHSQVNELRSEVASARVSNDELCAEYQKLWMEESQRNKVLSEENEMLSEENEMLSKENEMLKKLQQEGVFSSQKDRNEREFCTPRDAQIESGELIDISSGTIPRSKRKKHSESETVNATSHGSGQDDAILREPTSLNGEGLTSRAHVSVKQAECCRRAIVRSGDGLRDNDTANCLFQALVEYLVGMKLSILAQNERICMSAEHELSGYSFSLTWVEEADGKEVELLYNVLSLGTLERIAPQWMKEEIMFTTAMCPVFFERVSRVVKLFS